MLTIKGLRDYCLSRHSAVEDFPFGFEVAVYKVMGKVFALVPVEGSLAQISLKCDPVLAVMLRDTYPAVTPGYHLNKRECTLHGYQFERKGYPTCSNLIPQHNP